MSPSEGEALRRNVKKLTPQRKTKDAEENDDRAAAGESQVQKVWGRVRLRRPTMHCIRATCGGGGGCGGSSGDGRNGGRRGRRAGAGWHGDELRSDGPALLQARRQRVDVAARLQHTNTRGAVDGHGNQASLSLARRLDEVQGSERGGKKLARVDGWFSPSPLSRRWQRRCHHCTVCAHERNAPLLERPRSVASHTTAKQFCTI